MNTDAARTGRVTYLDDEIRMLFRNLAVPDRTRNLNVEQWVRYCKRMGATTVFLDIKTGFANWDTQLIPRDPVLGDRDLGAELARAARKHGLKYCFYLHPFSVDSIAPGHDDWQQRMANGDLEAKGWFCNTVFCFNSGYRELLRTMLVEITERYRPHGYFFDGFSAGFTACYCAGCRAKYRQETGRELPATPDWTSPEWYDYLEWRYREQAEAARFLHEVVHGVDPQVAIVWNAGSVWRGWYAAQSPAKAQWLDFACVELPVGTLRSDLTRLPAFTYADYIAWGIGVTRAFQNGRRANFYHYFQPDSRLAEAVGSTNVVVAAGAQVCIQEQCNHVRKVLSRVRRVEPYVLGAVSAADVALHFSERAHNLYYHPNDMAADIPFYHETGGVFKGLLSLHMPTEIVTDDWLETGDLSAFRVLVLPNSVHLSSRAVERLHAYLAAGGAILASMETGLRDRHSRRTGEELLWPGSDLRFRAEIETVARRPRTWEVALPEEDAPANPDQFLRFDSRQSLKRWIGEDITLGPRPDGVETWEGMQLAGIPSCQLPTRAVEIAAGSGWEVLFHLRFRRSKQVGWEECPAAVTRRYGRGRVTYVNFQFGTLISGTMLVWWRHLLERLLQVTAGAGPVRVRAPLCVKTFLWWQPAERRYVLHLVNELSSQGVREMQRDDQIPVPATVRIALPGVRRVRQVIGDAGCRIRRAGRTWVVECSRITERSVLVCDVAASGKR